MISFPKHIQKLRLCDSCLASKGRHVAPELNYRNLGSDACWPETFIDHSTYLAMGGALSPWRFVEGFQLETVCFDWLHNVYLGVARDLIGSAIWLFIRQGMYDHWNLDNMDDLLGNIHMEIVTNCKQYGFFAQQFRIFLAT